MGYCTQAHLVERFGSDELTQLTDRAGEGTINESVVDEAIADAGGVIDGYVVAAGYALPLSPVPRILEACACDIARYRLYDEGAPDQVAKRHDDAIRFLRLLAEGKVRLDAREPSPAAGAAEMVGGRQVFSGGGY